MAKTEIPELTEKFDFLLGHPTPRYVARRQTGSEIKSRPGLAKAIGLESHSDLYTSHGGLSDRIEEGIRRIYEISFNSECWNGFAVGDAADFIEEHKALHKNCFDEEPLRDLPPHRERHLGLLLKTKRLKVEFDDDRPELAGLDLWLAQRGPNEPWPVSIDLTCQATPVANFQLGVRRGRLEIDPGDANIPPDTGDRLGGQGPVCFSLTNPDSTITLTIANAKGGIAAWDISSDDGPIGIFRLDDEQILCRVQDLSPDDQVLATFKVFVKDLDPVEAVPDDDEDEEERDPFSFLRTDGRALSPAKKKLIKAILMKDELSVPKSGFITVAADGRIFDKDATDDA